MDLYLYKIGASTPVITIENAVYYADNLVETEDGAVYGPFASDCELSRREDCSEALRAKWRAEHLSAEDRVEELEALVAEILFGGFAGETGGKAV